MMMMTRGLWQLAPSPKLSQHLLIASIASALAPQVQVGCVSAEAKVLDKAKAASTASRCDPSCAGQCFAGMCLYAPTDLDSEDPTASLLGGLESTQKASALAEVRNQEPVAAASSEQVQRATAALVAVQESMAKLQANRPQPGAWPPS
eukprot:2020056-Amphidinium_carterae.1